MPSWGTCIWIGRIGGKEHTGGSKRERYFLGREMFRWNGSCAVCSFEYLTPRIHCQPFSVPWGADHCGLHHPGSLALWLPVGFGHREALAGGLRVEGERGQDVYFSIPFLLRNPSSDSGCLLYNCGFCQEALLPWFHLLLDSNNMFSSPCS